jgi:hypothetical protein
LDQGEVVIAGRHCACDRSRPRVFMSGRLSAGKGGRQKGEQD